MLITSADPKALALLAEAQTHYKGSSLADCDNAIVRYISYLKDPETDALLALATGYVQKARHTRTDPSQYLEDLKYRELWIDYVWSSGAGCGQKVMDELGEALAKHAEPPHSVVRRNIYLMCNVTKLGFYDMCVYTPIYTDTEHEDDPFDFGECWGRERCGWPSRSTPSWTTKSTHPRRCTLSRIAGRRPSGPTTPCSQSRPRR